MKSCKQSHQTNECKLENLLVCAALRRLLRRRFDELTNSQAANSHPHQLAAHTSKYVLLSGAWKPRCPAAKSRFALTIAGNQSRLVESSRIELYLELASRRDQSGIPGRSKRKSLAAHRWNNKRKNAVFAYFRLALRLLLFGSKNIPGSFQYWHSTALRTYSELFHSFPLCFRCFLPFEIFSLPFSFFTVTFYPFFFYAFSPSLRCNFELFPCISSSAIFLPKKEEESILLNPGFLNSSVKTPLFQNFGTRKFFNKISQWTLPATNIQEKFFSGK